MQSDGINNLLPAETLIDDREDQIKALERELKLLEGDDEDEDDEDEPSPLDSSQTHSLSGSITKQMAYPGSSTTMTQNEMNEIR